MKRTRQIAALLLIVCLLAGCAPVNTQESTPPTEDQPVWLNMNMEYPKPTALPNGGGQRVKVILLLGQSNATGCSLTSYLQKDVTAEEYAAFEAGYPTVLINY